MRRAGKIDLRSFQQELTSRLTSKTAAQVASSRLGLACADQQWLIRLSDASEVINVPPIVKVPLTQPWFLGVSNIRGNLYTVIDFAGYLGRPGALGGAAERLVLFGQRAGELRTGIVVHRVLGLRNLAELAPASQPAGAAAWYGPRWMDATGALWQEIDLSKLAQDDAFLQVGR
jgi:twitching motility protein PilI